MTTSQDLAERLHGIEYGDKIAEADLEAAKNNELVIVTGYSDDNVEFEGAIYDEIGAYDGVVIKLDKDGICKGDDEGCEHCSAVQRGLVAPYEIDAQWSQEGYSWFIKTNIPNAAFFDVLEDGEKFCRGVVFAMSDLKEVLPSISTEEDLQIIEAMETYGGSFVQSLAAAAKAADMYNLAKIKATWAEYWQQYKEMAEGK